MSSPLRSYDLPGPLKAVLDKYDKPCKGAWTAAWVCLGFWLGLMAIGVALLSVSPNSSSEDEEGDPTSYNEALLWTGGILTIVSLAFMVAFAVMVVRGNPCKAKRRYANDALTDILSSKGYLEHPERMQAVDPRSWSVLAAQVDSQVNARMKQRGLRRLATAALISNLSS